MSLYSCPPDIVAKLKSIPVWSNFIYYLAAIYAATHGMKLYTGLFLLMATVSTLHHVFTEYQIGNDTLRKVFWFLDVFLCIGIFIFTVATVLTRKPPKHVTKLFFGRGQVVGDVITKVVTYKHLIAPYLIKNFLTPEIFIIVMLGGAALTCFVLDEPYSHKEHGLYDIYHSMWHLLTGMTMLLSVIVMSERGVH